MPWVVARKCALRELFDSFIEPAVIYLSKNMSDAEIAIIEKENYTATVPINTNNTESNGNDSANDVYDPLQNRKHKNPNSDLHSFANLLKGSLGAGILSMPAAFKDAGTVVGVISTIILGGICTHCVYLLIKTSRKVSKICRVPSLGYAETGEAVFATGPKALRKMATGMRILLDWAMALTILGACSAYILLIEETVSQLVNYYDRQNGITKWQYYLIFLIPVLLFTQIKDLKHLAPFSAFANTLLVGTFCICLYYILSDFPSFTSQPISVDITKIPLFIGTAMFAMEGIGIVLPVENNMAKPQHFLGCPGVLNLTMVVVVFLYTTLGLLGYVRYGNNASGNIIYNLPMEHWPAVMAKVFIVLAIFFTYTLNFYVPIEIIWRNIKKGVPHTCHELAERIIRAIIATLTVGAAALLPRLDKAIALEGAFFYSFLGIIAPAALHLVYKWDRGFGKFKYILITNTITILFGTFALVTGVIESIAEFSVDD